MCICISHDIQKIHMSRPAKKKVRAAPTIFSHPSSGVVSLKEGSPPLRAQPCFVQPPLFNTSFSPNPPVIRKHSWTCPSGLVSELLVVPVRWVSRNPVEWSTHVLLRGRRVFEAGWGCTRRAGYGIKVWDVSVALVA